MERDCKAQDVAQWEPWYGEVREGVFWTEEPLASVRGEWLREGVVPQAGASGFNQFSWIRRFAAEGKEMLITLHDSVQSILQQQKRVLHAVAPPLTPWNSSSSQTRPSLHSRSLRLVGAFNSN